MLSKGYEIRFDRTVQLVLFKNKNRIDVRRPIVWYVTVYTSETVLLVARFVLTTDDGWSQKPNATISKRADVARVSAELCRSFGRTRTFREEGGNVGDGIVGRAERQHATPFTQQPSG